MKLQHITASAAPATCRGIASALFAGFVVSVSAVAALAHAHLVSASPGENASVPSPSEIALRFSEPLEQAFTAIVVRDAAGRQVDKHDTRLDKSDGLTLRVSVPPLTAGQYRVDWRTVSTDSHKMKGGYTFRVSP